MQKTIIIVESPSKIPSIQKYLGNNYTVLASKGHIVELAKGNNRYGIGVNPLNKFKTFYTLMPDKIQVLDQVISNIDNINQIILATDPDLEGEAISYHLMQYLKHLGKPIFRAEFNEITKEGVCNGLKNLKSVDLNKFKAQETRRILDRIVGFMVSPFLINYYGNNLSAGRVQSVATKLIIEREREINIFEPQEYWNITVILSKEEQVFNAKLNRKDRISSKEEAEQIKSILEKPSVKDSIFKVISVVKKPKYEYPDSPFNTAKMQKIMASKFGIDGERTMASAQALYESGFVTYIRTDSVRASDTAVLNVREWISKNGFEIPKQPNLFKNKDAAQDAHECIRPTDINNLPEKINLIGDDQILYKLIWEYFVSSQMISAVYDTLDIKIIHEISKMPFKINGKLLKNPGYLALLENRSKSEKTLPTINKDDLLKLVDDKSILLEQKFTQPPPRYNYGSFVNELEERGIGRPSTYAEIISKITNRQYVEKQNSTYHGTELGDKITTVLSKYFEFMNYEYTSDLEKQMDNISNGSINYIDILNSFYQKFNTTLNKAHTDNNGKICIKCNAPMFLKNGRNDTKFWGCSLYPFCVGVQ